VKQLRTRLVCSGGLLLVAGLICYTVLSVLGWPKQEVTAYNPNNLIRLHVIANSNSNFDQQLKLKVRDQVLQATRPMLSNNTSAETADRAIKNNLNYIEAVARAALLREGYNYPVRAEYGWKDFPDRRYGDQLVPQGSYRALRLVIGSGAGRNWWCVLFPPMCFSDLGKSVEPAEVQTSKVEIKFRLVERLQELGKQRLAQK
jgi:stage II sporulation protein R